VIEGAIPSSPEHPCPAHSCKDQAIPGAAATIDLEDMDHFEQGLRNESKNTPLIVTTKSLLALLPKIKWLRHRA
jgi:hypothetical protein